MALFLSPTLITTSRAHLATCICSPDLYSPHREQYNHMYVVTDSTNTLQMYTLYDVVEAHCYVVNIGRTDHEHTHSKTNNSWCKTFWLCRPLSIAYKSLLTISSPDTCCTYLCMYMAQNIGENCILWISQNHQTAKFTTPSTSPATYMAHTRIKLVLNWYAYCSVSSLIAYHSSYENIQYHMQRQYSVQKIST